jgi:hypothetical protein
MRFNLKNKYGKYRHENCFLKGNLKFYLLNNKKNPFQAITRHAL